MGPLLQLDPSHSWKSLWTKIETSDNGEKQEMWDDIKNRLWLIFIQAAHEAYAHVISVRSLQDMDPIENVKETNFMSVYGTYYAKLITHLH